MSVYIAINKKNDLRFKKENDRNMFNLSFVNQSTRALFSELRLEKLYQLCIDMIRELTSSSVTSFSLYDEGSSKFVLKGYKDIINFNNYYIEFTIKDLSKDLEKSVFNVEEDMDILREIFEDTSVFEKLSAKYIVLLKKEKIIGVVTLGKPLSGEEYDLKTLEQVESLSTSIYISIMNALYIEEISMQKEKIESQLDSIGRLNRTIKNINSCESLEEMLEVCSDTLRFSYGVNKGAIIVRDSDYRFKLANGIGFDYLNDKYINEASKILKIDEFYFSFEYSKANKYIKDFIDDVDFNGSRNCLIISPIRLDIFEKNSEGIFGYIVIWDTGSMIKSNDLVSIETLTNSMAPIVRQFLLQNQKMEILSEDSRKIFKKRIDELNLSSFSYRIYYKFIHCELFEDVDLDLYRDVDHYYFSSMLLCTAYKDEEIDSLLFDGYVEGGKDSFETLSKLHKEYMKKLERK